MRNAVYLSSYLYSTFCESVKDFYLFISVNLHSAPSRMPTQMFTHGYLYDLLTVFRYRNLQTSKVPFESRAQGSSLFTSAASRQRGCLKGRQKEVRDRLPGGLRASEGAE